MVLSVNGKDDKELDQVTRLLVVSIEAPVLLCCLWNPEVAYLCTKAPPVP